MIIHVVHSGGGGDASTWWNVTAAWVTALATVGLFLFAIITARYAARAFRKQSEDVALAREQADRDIEERRRAQAAQVYIVITNGIPQTQGALVVARGANTSDQPIYDIDVRWCTAAGPFGSPSVLPQVLPGQSPQFTQEWSVEQGIAGLGVSIAFRDAKGIHWQTTDRGKLTELCGAYSPAPALDRCMRAPGHGGRHSWDPATPPTQGDVPSSG